MLLYALLWVLGRDEPDRTSAIYRCPAVEGESTRFEDLVSSTGYSFYCIDPKPGPKARKAASAAKMTFVSPASIDTRPNRRWRDATIAMASGAISPREWLNRTRDLHETVHFLSSPSTPPLRPTFGNNSPPAVFAEIFLLSWRGKPCITTEETWSSRWLPDAGRLQSWILAMNDLCGPMLQYRHDNPEIVTGQPEILRADSKPGLLIFRQRGKSGLLTFYFNNSNGLIRLPKIDTDHITINRGLNIDDNQALNANGFCIEETPK